jgi:hypothetical protein
MSRTKDQRADADFRHGLLVVWLFRLLVFKLMFLSGVVKLAAGDPTWRNLTALDYHYWTTCIPNWLGWYVAKLPLWSHQAAAGAMFFVELVVPFAMFGPPRLRALGAALIVALQLVIASTGNYGFFNLLTGVLALSWLDDADWRALLPKRFRTASDFGGRGFSAASERAASPPGDSAPLAPRPRFLSWRHAPALVLAAIVLPASFVQIQAPLFGYQHIPPPILAAMDLIAPFRSVNGYGLFANMTTTRPEIVVEGSNDGETWTAYEFRYKPGDPNRAPPFVQPHMPRLDWQMWFAALGNVRRNPWLVRFLERLTEGSPEVLGLLERNPFEGAPPKFVRAVVYEYEFTDFGERRQTGAWWSRVEKGLYCPVVRGRREDAQ